MKQAITLSWTDELPDHPTTILINSFAARQTPTSRFSYFSGSDKELLARIRESWGQAKPGYRSGVILVPIKPQGVFSGVVRLQAGDALTGDYKARREGEKPRKSVVVEGREKMAAATVDVVLYNSMVLAEEDGNELPGIPDNWEVISINASPELEATPIQPNVLMHNHFGSDGGTKTNLSDKGFVAMLRESFIYWSDKVLAGCINKDNKDKGES
jgi:hypothetical protein